MRSTTDITARCIQGKVAFHSFQKLESADKEPAEDKIPSLQCILRINHALQMQQLGSTESHA